MIVERVSDHRRRTSVLLGTSLAIMTAASVATHLIGVPASGEAAEQTEHALAVPTFIGPLGALFLLGVVRLLHRRAFRPVWFLVLPPAAFVIQEIAERFVLGPEAEPNLLATAMIQLPFALLAFVVARFVLTVVRRVVRLLTAGTRRSRPRMTATAWPTVRLSIPPLRPSAGVHQGRAPPHLA